MADSRRSSMGSPQERQERRRAPRQPGATGSDQDQPATPEEAQHEAEHRFGKTNQTTSEP